MILYGLKYTLLLIFFGFFGLCVGQKMELKYRFESTDPAYKIPRYFSQKKSINATTLLQNEIENAKIVLAKQGYFAAEIRDTLIDPNHLELKVFLGKEYKEISVNFSDEILDATTIAWNQYENIGGLTFFKNPSDYSEVLRQIMSFYQNQGYPFSQLKFTKFTMENEALSLEVKMDKGRKMIWKEAKSKEILCFP